MAEVTEITVKAKRATGRSTAEAVAFNISNFRNSLPYGVMRTNLFRVEISMPKIVVGSPISSYRGSDTEFLTFMCCAGTIPGVRLATTEVKRYGFGPTEKVPVSHAFDDIVLYFIGDGGGRILRFFRNWTRGILEYSSVGNIKNDDLRSGDYAIGNPVQNMSSYFVNYKTEYRSQINITSFHESGKYVSDKVGLLNAFPVDIKDIQLNWADNNQLMLVPVSFSFFDFFEYGRDSTLKATGISYDNGLNLLEKIYKGVTGVQEIKSFKKPRNIGDAVNIVRETSNIIKDIFN